MPAAQLDRIVPPLEIVKLMHGRWAIQTLRSGVELMVFDSLKPAALTAEELAMKGHLDAKAAELLLNALTSLGFLNKNAGHFELTELSRTYLVSDSPLYFGAYILQEPAAETWCRLTDSVRTGKPVSTVDKEDVAEQFFPQLAEMIFPLSYATALALASQLRVETLPGMPRLLDIGAGAAPWSIAFAQYNENLTVDAVDFPSVLLTTRKFVNRYGLSERFSYLGGNWNQVSLLESHYDLVVLGHLLHSEGERRSVELLQNCHATLKTGGMIVIAEFFTDEDNTSPVFPQLFALNMLLHTTEGCVFSEQQLGRMLMDRGFRDARRVSLPFLENLSPIMVAVK